MWLVVNKSVVSRQYLVLTDLLNTVENNRRFTMDPNIQLIQLMLRVEREAEVQRPPQVSYRNDLADENPVCSTKRDNRTKQSFNLPRRRRQYEGA
jgi:hypothetical protein